MSATEQKDEAEPEFETCPEIDENFFKEMGETAIHRRASRNLIHLLTFSNFNIFRGIWRLYDSRFVGG